MDGVTLLMTARGWIRWTKRLLNTPAVYCRWLSLTHNNTSYPHELLQKKTATVARELGVPVDPYLGLVQPLEARDGRNKKLVAPLGSARRTLAGEPVEHTIAAGRSGGRKRRTRRTRRTLGFHNMYRSTLPPSLLRTLFPTPCALVHRMD